MAKTLKDFKGGFKPNSEAEANFIDKHVVIKHPDRNGNGDDVFKASNIKYVNRAAEGHGYDTEADAAVYESVEDLDEEHGRNKSGGVISGPADHSALEQAGYKRVSRGEYTSKYVHQKTYRVIRRNKDKNTGKVTYQSHPHVTPFKTFSTHKSAIKHNLTSGMVPGHGYNEELDLVGDLDLTEAESKGRKAAEFKPKQVQGLYHYNHYEHPDGSWFQAHVSNGTRKTKQFVVKKAGEKQHTTYNNVADVKKHLGINESYTEPQNLKFHDQVDAYHKKVGGTRKGNSIHYKPGEGDFGAVASNHMSRHGWHPTRNPGEKVHKHGHTMTTKNEKKKDGWHTTLTFHEKQNESVELDENTEKKYWVTHNAIGEKSKKLVGHTKPFKSLNDAKEHINNMTRKGDWSAKRIHVSGKDGHITHNFNYDGHNMSYRNPTGVGDASMEKHLIKESVEQDNRKKGIAKAKALLATEEVEQIDESWTPEDATNYKKAAVAAKKAGDKWSYHEHMIKYHNRMSDKFEIDGNKIKANYHSGASSNHYADQKNTKKIHEDVELEETYTIKSLGHEKTAVIKGGKVVKTFHGPSAPADARLHLSKLVKEDAEHLDELSKATLRSYVNKASTDILHKGMDFANNSTSKKGDKALKKATNHFRGINVATAKLAPGTAIVNVPAKGDFPKKKLKEDFNYNKDSVIDSVLEKFIEPKLTPLTLEEKLVRNLSDLPESSSKLVLDLFNTLDEENQKYLVRLSEDADEHVGLVDFALDNKDLM